MRVGIDRHRALNGRCTIPIMAIDVVGDLGNAQKLAAALGPVLDSAVETLTAGLATSGIAATEGMLRRVLDGATITINLKPIPK